MSLAALITDLVRAGTDPELVGRVAEALALREPVIIKDEQAERRRAADRERKRASTIPQNSAETADTPAPSLPPSSSPPITPLTTTPDPSPPSTTLPAREREFRFAISAEYQRAGFLPPDTGRAVIWLQNGWQESICVEAVRSGLAKKRKLLPLNYFEGQIADAHAPVPIGQANQRAGPAPRERSKSAATAILERARERSQNERHYAESQSVVIDALPIASGAR